MIVPIKRGTARRLGIVRPLPPGVYWAPLPGPRGIAAVNTPMARSSARRLGLRDPRASLRHYRQRWVLGHQWTEGDFSENAIRQSAKTHWPKPHYRVETMDSVEREERRPHQAGECDAPLRTETWTLGEPCWPMAPRDQGGKP